VLIGSPGVPVLGSTRGEGGAVKKRRSRKGLRLTTARASRKHCGAATHAVTTGRAMRSARTVALSFADDAIAANPSS
jgi:hypothetical protein